MAHLIYLLAAVAASVVIWLFSRLLHRRPKSVEAGMEQFSKGLNALAPQDRSAGRGSGEDAGTRPEAQARRSRTG
ncbi:MAG: hypothetical protein ACYDH5_04070 [Acidimicrobiales bacterium]